MTATLPTQTSPRYRWDVDSFLRAHEAGVFDGRVELVDGEVWRVVLGTWPGTTTWRVGLRLTGQGVLTNETLVGGGSLPDPDVWVRGAEARPVEVVGRRLSRWDPADVLLVVEVSVETVQEDLTVKARLYGSAGWQRYWVVVRDGVHEHTEPYAEGYRCVRRLGVDDDVELPDGTSVPVRRLLED